MFPDLTMLAAMMKPAMIEHLERQGILAMKLFTETTGDHVKHYDGTNEIADFILNQFVALTEGETNDNTTD